MLDSVDNQLLKSGYTVNATMEAYWEESHIKDDFLAMMFASCHPKISQENQVTFMLKVLCGFSVKEIATAFLCTPAVIAKRLLRTKDFFRTQQIKPRIPEPDALADRIHAVLACIYLLFNEGYKSSQSKVLIREDLIEQAIYLGGTLLENEKTRYAQVYGLMALMYFQAARSKGRVSTSGALILLKAQNRQQWNQSYISIGALYLQKAAKGKPNSYTLEAMIAYEHCKAKDFEATNWSHILGHYNQLYHMTQDPVIALHRAMVILELEGARAAIEELNKLSTHKALQHYYVYHAAACEIFLQDQQLPRAKFHLQNAIKCCTSPQEKVFFEQKLQDLSALA